MKDSYNKDVLLRCITCGDTEFEFNDDKSWIKCIRCGREYDGGQDELIELNQKAINDELEDSKEEILKDLKKNVSEMFKESFKGNKYLKFK